MVWFTMELAAAVCWGLSYALSENILKNHMSVPVYMLLSSLVGTFFSMLLVLATASGRQGWKELLANPTVAAGPALNACLYFVGTILVYSAIQRHNATSVGFVEITYPLFTALFAFWLFGAIQINPSIIAGSLLILAGLVIIRQQGT
jgi:drug/metabolite transporter (DMT)-like permease